MSDDEHRNDNLFEKHLRLEGRVDVVERDLNDLARRVDGHDREIGRDTHEGLRGSVHETKNMVQQFIGFVEPLTSAIHEMKEDLKDNSEKTLNTMLKIADIQASLATKSNMTKFIWPIVVGIVAIIIPIMVEVLAHKH